MSWRLQETSLDKRVFYSLDDIAADRRRNAVFNVSGELGPLTSDYPQPTDLSI
jgi:hypothetical protein